MNVNLTHFTTEALTKELKSRGLDVGRRIERFGNKSKGVLMPITTEYYTGDEWVEVKALGYASLSDKFDMEHIPMSGAIEDGSDSSDKAPLISDKT